MRITKQTPRRTWIAYTPEEIAELHLKLPRNYQVWHTMYHDALQFLMDRGVSLERAVRYILRGCATRAGESRSFKRALWLQRRRAIYGHG